MFPIFRVNDNVQVLQSLRFALAFTLLLHFYLAFI